MKPHSLLSCLHKDYKTPHMFNLSIGHLVVLALCDNRILRANVSSMHIISRNTKRSMTTILPVFIVPSLDSALSCKVLELNEIY